MPSECRVEEDVAVGHVHFVCVAHVREASPTPFDHGFAVSGHVIGHVDPRHCRVEFLELHERKTLGWVQRVQRRRRRRAALLVQKPVVVRKTDAEVQGEPARYRPTVLEIDRKILDQTRRVDRVVLRCQLEGISCSENESVVGSHSLGWLSWRFRQSVKPLAVGVCHRVIESRLQLMVADEPVRSV